MSRETDHGFYQEFSRTPQENNIVRDRKRIKNLEDRVSELEKIIKEITECHTRQDG